MTDQPRLREVLHRAVPEAPVEPGRSSAARGLAAKRRRARRAWTGALAVVVVLGGAGIWAANRQHDSRLVVAGSGQSACRALVDRLGSGTAADNRVVTGATAARWLHEVAADVDAGRYVDERQVTVCVVERRATWSTYVVGGGHAERVTTGGYNQGPDDLATVMSRLDRLPTGGAQTTDAPFTCNGPSTERYPDVSSDLPTGASAAIICYDSPFYTPSQVLRQHVGRLVAAVNATRIGYSTPHVECSVAGGDYGYSMVFQYPGGTRKVTAETCRGLIVGRVTRAEDHLDGTFLRLLAEETLAAQGFHPAPACTASTHSRPSGVGDVRHLLGLRYCAPGVAGAGAPVGGDGMTVLEQWGAGFVGATTQPEGHCTSAREGLPYLSLRDVWGNAFTMTVTSCGRHQFTAVLAPDGRHVIYPLGEGGPSIDGVLRQLARANP